MAEIFISYKSERRPAARHLAKLLDAYGFHVWYDYGLIPGHDFEPRLMAEMKAAKAVIVLWCGMAVDSPWVNKEAREARREGKYLPCRLESCALPPDFAAADTINLTEWDGAPRSHMLDRLLGDLSRRLGRDPAINFNRLRELDEDWRGYGAPSLAKFALGKTLMPADQTPKRPPSSQPALGPPPAGLSPNLAQHWENAQNGDAAAVFEIAWAYDSGSDSLPKDEREAARLYRMAADQGYAAAQNNLGVMYQNGRGGLPKNDHEGLRLYRMAADQGYALAQSNLGLMYRDGKGGLSKNDHEAVRLFQLATNQGNASGQCNLAFMYEEGRGGLAKDEREAVRLYKLAADQGNVVAQCNLAFMYHYGRGVAANHEEAARLYRLAADRGLARAQNNLGVMYKEGNAGLAHDTEAVRLFRLAAEQGSIDAQVNLGFMHASGRGGLAKDEREAVRLYQLAARQGDNWAQQELKRRGKSW